MQQTLGERFLRYYLPIDTSEEHEMAVMRRSFSNVSKEPEKQKTLQHAVKRFLGTFEGRAPTISDAMQNRLAYLARIVARLRGVVPRDFAGEKIMYRPQMEGPARIGKQLYKMLIALANLEGKDEVTEKEFEIVYRSDRSLYERFLKAFHVISKDPSQGKPLHGQLRGLFSYRMGSYRILNETHHNRLVVVIIDLGHRKGIYK
jgi:mRNA interferase RelE/StbE